MRARLGNSDSLKQGLALCSSGEPAGLVSQPFGLFGHSIFKGAGLLHPAALLGHGDRLQSPTINVPAH
ncbi:hypothetical protein FHR88_000335 [Bradyrhizobium betae]|nr:hypothetical protein [Bradyrhizobium betae]